MREFSAKYIERCIIVGILTKEEIHKYPLRSANLAMVLKAYAVASHQPYDLSKGSYALLDPYKLYLTEEGFDWLLGVFNSHSFRFLRRTFPFVFTMAKRDDVSDPNYQGYRNFRGLIGDRPKAGTKQGAVLVRTYGRNNERTQEFKFKTLKKAREELVRFLRFYPPEEFTLYRLKKQKVGGKYKYYRSEVPLMLEENNRGIALRGSHK